MGLYFFFCSFHLCVALQAFLALLGGGGGVFLGGPLAGLGLALATPTGGFNLQVINERSKVV